MKTITGVEIKVTANHSARTFTIRKNTSKYRTTKFPNKQEFDHANRFWTANDWQNFLSSTSDYYVVR